MSISRLLWQYERLLFVLFLLLQLHLLWSHWGLVQGFDAWGYLEMFREVQWFRPLPNIRDFFYGYHPPLAYNLQSMLSVFFPDAIKSSQVLSFLSVTGGMVFLRGSLKHIGILSSVAGMCLLYLTSSLPLFIYLTTETGNSALAFFWTMLTLHLSVRLFWKRVMIRKFHWREGIFLILLTLTLAASLLTKFTGLLNVALPFLVIAIRQRGWEMGKKSALAAAMCIFSLMSVGPFYYFRYYRTEGEFFPNTMKWARAADVQYGHAIHDEDPFLFFAHALRFPEQTVRTSSTPLRDSLIDSVWFQTWKREVHLGAPSALSSFFSAVYSEMFAVVLVLGSVAFFLFRPIRPSEFFDVGCLLIGVTLLNSVALLAFGYQYPVWDWAPFKAKHIAPALLWIPYCGGLVASVLLRCPRTKRIQSAFQNALISFVVLFMMFNHLVPVY
jgi:hypothetical protein